MQTAAAGAYYNIPLTDAIYEAKKHLAINDDSDDDFLEILAWNAVRHIGAVSSVKTIVKRIKVCEGSALLPPNVKRFLWFRIVQDESNSNINVPAAVNWSWMFADIAFLNNLGCDDTDIQDGQMGVYNAYNYVRINDNKLQFSNRRNIFFDEIDVAFVGYDVDAEGVFWVTDVIKEAVTFRICSQYSFAHSKRYDRDQKNFWTTYATSLANKAKGDAAMDYFKENIDQIQQMYRAYYYSRVVSRKLSR